MVEAGAGVPPYFVHSSVRERFALTRGGRVIITVSDFDGVSAELGKHVMQQGKGSCPESAMDVARQAQGPRNACSATPRDEAERKPGICTSGRRRVSKHFLQAPIPP